MNDAAFFFLMNLVLVMLGAMILGTLVVVYCDWRDTEGSK